MEGIGKDIKPTAFCEKRDCNIEMFGGKLKMQEQNWHCQMVPVL